MNVLSARYSYAENNPLSFVDPSGLEDTGPPPDNTPPPDLNVDPSDMPFLVGEPTTDPDGVTTRYTTFDPSLVPGGQDANGFAGDPTGPYQVLQPAGNGQLLPTFGSAASSSQQFVNVATPGLNSGLAASQSVSRGETTSASSVDRFPSLRYRPEFPDLGGDIAKAQGLAREAARAPGAVLLPNAIPDNASVAANMALAAKHMYDPLWFASMVRTNGPWDYKVRDAAYRDFGNFNYGATGRAAGFPEALLLRAAGAYQYLGPTADPAFGNPTRPPFGDSPQDQFWIRQGSLLYEQSMQLP